MKKRIAMFFKALWFVLYYGDLTKENYCEWKKLNLTQEEKANMLLKPWLN